MKNLLPYILSALCLVSCIKERQTGADLAVGDPIPDFSVTMNDATEVTAEQLSRGISVIMFFTTACPDCRQTLPLMQTLYDEYASKEVRFVLISRQEGRESIERYWRENGLTLPYSAQNDRVVYELFAQTRVPRVYICKDGIIKAIYTDQPQNPTFDQLSAALNSL